VSDTPYWWERRREGEATTVYLGRVLDDLGATDLAERARLGHFDDYFCPDEVDDGANIHRLIHQLGSWACLGTRERRTRAKVMIEAAKDGEFDGTREEADRWAKSPDGQQAFHDLMGDIAGSAPPPPRR
jgi:hypothetical protein